MIAEATREEKIFRVYELFQKNALRYKKSIQFPDNTDPRKTYSWRYLNNFVKKLEKEDISDDMMSTVIAHIVEDGYKTKSLYRRGIAILDEKDAISKCINELEREVNDEMREIKNIQASYLFVLKEMKVGKKRNLKETLSERKRRLGYANIVRWFRERRITAGFISLSKSCIEALEQLDDDELSMLPSKREMRFKRHKLILNYKPQIREILGTELGDKNARRYHHRRSI